MSGLCWDGSAACRPEVGVPRSSSTAARMQRSGAVLPRLAGTPDSAGRHVACPQHQSRVAESGNADMPLHPRQAPSGLRLLADRRSALPGTQGEKSRSRKQQQPPKGVSLPRERFWNIPVTKIDSPTRQPLLPRPPCVRAASPHHRKLGAGYAALPQWLDGVSDALAYALRRLRDLRPLRHCGHTHAPTPTGDYPPRASHFHGGQRMK